MQVFQARRNGSFASIYFIGILGLILLMGSEVCLGQQEVWTSNDATGTTTIRRFGFDTSSLPTFDAGDRVGTIVLVGGEVWTSNDATGTTTIRRFALNRTPLGTFDAGDRVGVMAVVGNQVWTSNAATGTTTIRRFSTNTTSLGSFDAGDRVGAMAVVGSEVWTGNQATGSTTVRRFMFNTGSLSAFDAGDRVGAIAVVGNEVWTSNDATGTTTVRRFAFNTTSLGSFDAGDRVGVITVVANEVWTGNQATGTTSVRRFGFNTISLGSFDAGDRVGAMARIQGLDCNSNGVSDFQDIAGPTSEDCNTNLIPDHCEIAVGSPAPNGPYFCTQNCNSDCNDDGIPDECQVDCNNNDIPDDCDIAGPTSTDCNTNGVPDSCDIAGPTSIDCNTNAFPDECDLAGPTSADCNDNSTPDDCEAASGDIQWVGADGGQFTSPTNWSPAEVPGDAGNALLAHSGGTDNRCILSSGGTRRVCSVSISATGSGRQILQINEGSALETNDSTTVAIGGTVDLQGGRLGGGPVTNMSNTINGFGEVSADLLNDGLVRGRSAHLLSLTGGTVENGATGTLLSPIAAVIERTGGGSLGQAGVIEIQSIGALIVEAPLNNADGGLITLLNGTLGATGVHNSTGASLEGFGTIQSSVDNDGDMLIIADMQIIGDLVNNGTIFIQNGDLTVTGNVSGSGVIIGGFGG